MNRRTLIAAIAASAVLPLVDRGASAQTSLKTKNVVFVHGLFADGSCWSKVIARLQQKGVNCISVQNPLTSLHEASEAARRAIAAHPGPTVLVGHSFSGMIVTDVGVDPKVTALCCARTRCGRGLYGAGEELSDAPGHRRHCLRRRLGPVVGGGFSARFRGRLATGGRARPLRGSAAVQEVVDNGKDDQCRLAHQADLLCRVHPRPDDQSRPAALHGKANGREDHRDQGEPPSADLTSRRDHEPDPRGSCRLR
jgi:pimeloyl-ACP methyl ester carboxylesterase